MQIRLPGRRAWASAAALVLVGPWILHGAGQTVAWQLRDAKGRGLEDAVVSLHQLDAGSGAASESIADLPRK
jgi:hypothetical protein